MERGTHLTVAHKLGVERDDGKYHGDEGSHAHKGIDLWNRSVWASSAGRGPNEALETTDPYCPAARKMSSNDIPFVVKTGEEFPAGGEDSD